MKTIKLKKKPSFYVDLAFSKWLTQDKLLGIIINRRNQVEEIQMDKKFYPFILRELKSRRYV